MRVHVLVLNGGFDTGLAVVLDTFAVANELAAAGHGEERAGAAVSPTGRRPGAGTARPPAPAFDVRVVGVRARVRTAQGFVVSCTAADTAGRPDLVIVPALGATRPDALTAALAAREVRDAGRQLRAWDDAGAVLGTACTGAFVLADAGLLDGKPATTTWWLAPTFRARYPQVPLDETRMVVGGARHVTAGAALGHLDLALALVRRRSPGLAALVARRLVADEGRPSQAAFIVPDHVAHADPLVTRFEAWVRPRLAGRIALPEAARAVGASPRTLARRVRAVLGRSPLGYVQALRAEQAVHLLRTTGASVAWVAEQVGYADAVTLRALLRRETGRGVRELRRGVA